VNDSGPGRLPGGAAGERDRALGALQGLALGDALGMPFQLLSRADVAQRTGGVVDEFTAPDAGHPIAAGLPAGAITDDTEQALLVARLLVAGDGHIAPVELAHALVAWEDDMRRRGSVDLLGPSTTRAVQAVLRGEPVETAGRFGTTNGAAMRITPIGIATPADDLAVLIDAVEAASAVTHSTSLALAAASAVAAAVSTAIAGGDVQQSINAAIRAAEVSRERGHWVAGADVAERLRAAVALAQSSEFSLDRVATVVGTSLAANESVPAAFSIIARHSDDPWLAVRTAASLGGDADTIAAIVGAVTGALHGSATWPADAVATVDSVGGQRLGVASLGLDTLTDALLHLRHGRARE
jgi:ADP-ribosylglycohydrolase